MKSPHLTLDPPSEWVTRFAPLIRAGGPVLDLACGRGRHARYLTKLGYPVLAVDRDGAALESLAEIEGVTTLLADLEGGPWPFSKDENEPFEIKDKLEDKIQQKLSEKKLSENKLNTNKLAGIVVTNYLHRPLFPLLIDALEDKGVLIYETFMLGNERFGRPSNPDFLLQPNELLSAFGQCIQVVAFEQGEVSLPKAAMVQRICVVKNAKENFLP